MTTNSIKDRRPEPRYEVVRGRTLRVIVRRISHESQQAIRGELHNLSAGGVQIFLPAYLRFSEGIELQIDVPDAQIKIDVAAEVRWIRPLADNHCLIGCSLPVKLSDGVLDRLSTAGVIDRRRHPRRVVSVPASARRELDSESFPISIIDYSEAGFCTVSARPIPVGGAVSIALGDATFEAPIAGTVCWQEQRDGDYVLGCSLQRGQDIVQLRRFCNASSHVREPRSVRPGQDRPTLFLAAMWFLVFIGGAVIGLQAVAGWRGSASNGLAARRQPEVRSAPQSRSIRAVAENHTRPNRRRPLEQEVSGKEKLARPAPSANQPPTAPPSGESAVDIARLEVDTDLNQVDDESTAAKDDDAGEPQSLPRDATRSTHVAAVVGPQDRAQPIDEPAALPTAGKTSIPEVQKPPQSREREQQAKEAFMRGEQSYRGARYLEATQAFKAAVQHDPNNALARYFLAMAFYELGQLDKATTVARQAFRLEAKRPIASRGSRLSRYQGRSRLWIEQLRSQFFAALRQQATE